MLPGEGGSLEGEEDAADEEEIKELQEAARNEVEAAAAAVMGLPFEDKAKLVGALSPTAAVALLGAQCSYNLFELHRSSRETFSTGFSIFKLRAFG